jgi:hypothetical protein
MMSIWDQPMKCKRCGSVCTVKDCDCDDSTEEGDGNLGCPVPDCGGCMEMVEVAKQ